MFWDNWSGEGVGGLVKLGQRYTTNLQRKCDADSSRKAIKPQTLSKHSPISKQHSKTEILHNKTPGMKE